MTMFWILIVIWFFIGLFGGWNLGFLMGKKCISNTPTAVLEHNAIEVCRTDFVIESLMKHIRDLKWDKSYF